jgi:hypothetical protein
LIIVMQIEEGGGDKTMVLDRYNIRGIFVKVTKRIISMDDESADATKNHCYTPSMNELDEGEVPTSERLLTWSKAKRGVVDLADGVGSKYLALKSS